MNHLSNWIELPATDLARAIRFYEAVLDVHLATMDMGPLRYAIFPTRDRFNAGALVAGEGYTPSSAGPLVYLDGEGRIDAILARVTAAGGQVLMPRTHLSPEAGEVAIFLDSEGNKVGVQSAAKPRDPRVDDATMQRLLGGQAPGVAFLLRRGPAYEDAAGQALQWEHARNMFTLLRAGKLRSVTALVDGTDVLGVGLFAGSREECTAILREDPAVMGGRLVFELLTDMTFGAHDTAV